MSHRRSINKFNLTLDVEDKSENKKKESLDKIKNIESVNIQEQEDLNSPIDSLGLNLGEIKFENFEKISELGYGSSGMVIKARHIPTGILVAKKIIVMEFNSSQKAQIIRELKILHECNSRYIVKYLGSYTKENKMGVCMELMHCGSFDNILLSIGLIPEPILARIFLSVLEGIRYLKNKIKIIHRDIKPSNILLNIQGEIKICDFGISGILVDSLAQSFVGTKSYMAPERLQGGSYDISSDIWSLGITITELACGQYPIPPPTFSQIEKTFLTYEVLVDSGLVLSMFEKRTSSVLNVVYKDALDIFTLLDSIVKLEPPALPVKYYSKELCDILKLCLSKIPQERASIDKLLNHPFVKFQDTSPNIVVKWIRKHSTPEQFQDTEKGIELTYV